ncbi:hypothetical protein JCM18899A_14060 [Nocardioides sp. AN3]
MRIPVVLPTVDVIIDAAGALTATVDGQKYTTGKRQDRGDLADLIDQITTGMQTAVRVVVHEADGSTYQDISVPTATPPVDQSSSARSPSVGSPSAEPATRSVPVEGSLALGVGAISGAGFQPGEDVALAYVLAHKIADTDGRTVLRLPPALLAFEHGTVLMVGTSSHRVTLVAAANDSPVDPSRNRPADTALDTALDTARGTARGTDVDGDVDEPS